MNKDIVKQLLDELEIETSDHWTIKRKLGNMEFICYYYTFGNYDGDMLYAGYSMEKLKKIIKKELRKKWH